MGHDEFILHPGLIQDLEAAFRRNEWSREMVKHLTTGTTLEQFADVLGGYAEINAIPQLIDCSADPRIPPDIDINGLELEEHRRTGVLVWHPEAVTLYLSERQKGGGCIDGDPIREELRDKPVLNINVLDFLLAHQRLIPKAWRGKLICFWGTVYSRQNVIFIPALSYEHGKWVALLLNPVDNFWNEKAPAVMLKV